MAKLSDEVQDFLRHRLAFVATADIKGRPNIVPKGNIEIIDDSHIVFVDLYASRTKRNLAQNPNIAITIVNPAAYKGYQLKGKAKLIERGKDYDKLLKEIPTVLSHPQAKYAVKVKVDKVVDIGYGETADKEI